MDEETNEKDNQEVSKEDKQEETKAEESKAKPDNESEKITHNIPETKDKVNKDKFEKVKEYKNNLTDKMRKNPWIASTFLLGVFMLVIMLTGFSGITGGTVSEGEVGKVVLELVNSQLPGAELIEVNQKSGLYEVVVLFEGREIPIYITADGKNLVQGVTPLDDVMQQNQPSEGYSEEDIETISTFIDCLAEKGVKIYGANWCGWTKKLVVETLGGFDVAIPIYVECTENQELCSLEGIEGYPTIKIDGELYEGSRTFEGFAEATGCPVPEVNNVQSTSTEEATC